MRGIYMGTMRQILGNRTEALFAEHILYLGFGRAQLVHQYLLDSFLVPSSGERYQIGSYREALR
jgi:hypothetical protein